MLYLLIYLLKDFTCSTAQQQVKQLFESSILAIAPRFAASKADQQQVKQQAKQVSRSASKAASKAAV
jgi:hypothetical protein